MVELVVDVDVDVDVAAAAVERTPYPKLRTVSQNWNRP